MSVRRTNPNNVARVCNPHVPPVEHRRRRLNAGVAKVSGIWNFQQNRAAGFSLRERRRVVGAPKQVLLDGLRISARARLQFSVTACHLAGSRGLKLASQVVVQLVKHGAQPNIRQRRCDPLNVVRRSAWMELNIPFIIRYSLIFAACGGNIVVEGP